MRPLHNKQIKEKVDKYRKSRMGLIALNRKAEHLLIIHIAPFLFC